MIARLYSLNKQFINLNGKLLALPKLIKAFIMDAFSYGWDRNRAIDTLGTHNNALMGGYLLAASNTVISIAGILTTDTIVPLTSGGNVGTVTVNGTMSFTAGNKYGAFEVYRAGALIGRYCLAERQGLQIINQITGGLPNGLLGGTTTTVWQRSNAFYSETNERGYSISGTGWVTSAGVALTVGTIVPSDPLNPTKCMAWVSSVQQDLQFVGKARNSISIMPTAFYCNGDRQWIVPKQGKTVTQHKQVIRCVLNIADGDFGNYTPYHGINRGILVTGNVIRIYYPGISGSTMTLPRSYYHVPIEITLQYVSSVVSLTVLNMHTGYSISGSTTTTATLSIPFDFSYVASRITSYYFKGYIGSIEEWFDNVKTLHILPDQHSTNYIDIINKSIITASGVTTNLLQNIDLVHNAYNQTGYELWYNGTDYRIYPIASDGTTIITPAGYTSQGKVTAGNMPSIADSRMSTFKYALANSCILRNSVPEAYDATDPCAPKLLTYSELSALSANPKVTKTEANGKITNLTIRQ